MYIYDYTPIQHSNYEDDFFDYNNSFEPCYMFDQSSFDIYASLKVIQMVGALGITTMRISQVKPLKTILSYLKSIKLLSTSKLMMVIKLTWEIGYALPTNLKVV